MKYFNITELISVIQIKIGMNTLFIYLVFIHLLIMEADAKMPAFIETLINPFINLFSWVGLPVHKRENNPFIYGSRTIDDWEINAEVREVNESELETRAKVFEIIDPIYPINKFKPYTDPMEKFDCDPEIPILVVDKEHEHFIMRTVNHNIKFSWELYPRVSETKVRSKFGFDTTLAQLLADASQAKETNAPKPFRPKPIVVQGGHSFNVDKPAENGVFNANRSSCNHCNDEKSNTKPKFPVYAPNCTGLNCNRNFN